MPCEGEEWLRGHAYDHDLGRDKMRPLVAYAALKAHFSGCLRNDMYLERDQVAKWIAKQKKKEKNRRRMKRAAPRWRNPPTRARAAAAAVARRRQKPRRRAHRTKLRRLQQRKRAR